MWRVAMKAAISAALMWLLLRNLDFGALLGQMASVDRGALLGAGVLLLAGTVALALRWTVILGALGMPRGLRVTFPLILIGRFFGQALPSGVGGDVARIWLGCKAGLSPRVSTTSVMADRLAGLLALLLIVTADIPVFIGILPNPALLEGVLFIVAIGYVGFAVLLALDRLPENLRRFWLVRQLFHLSAELRAILISPRAGGQVIACGFIAQGADVLAVFVLARGLDLPVDLASCLMIVPLANILQALPISIAGWGVRESFFVVTFGLVGVDAPAALAVSIMFGLLNILISLPGGILWLARAQGGVGEIRGTTLDPTETTPV
jgi:uncharacterized membrane protein YbhN (UPF0104 family)